jgi:hypothetical protein
MTKIESVIQRGWEQQLSAIGTSLQDKGLLDERIFCYKMN